MRKLVVILGLVTVLAFAACDSGANGGGGGSSGTTLTLGSSSFVGATSIAITAGQAVTFADPSDTGGIHHLVTGTNGTFSAEAGAPSEFSTSSGINFSPGTTMIVTFPTAGSYSITCTIHPTMQATITVS